VSQKENVAVCFTVDNNRLDSSWIISYLLSPSTGRIQQFACNTNHKQSVAKLLKLLNKYLLMVTFENGENYSIW